VYAFLLLVLLLVSLQESRYNVNIKILVCQTIGPVAPGLPHLLGLLRPWALPELARDRQAWLMSVFAHEACRPRGQKKELPRLFTVISEHIRFYFLVFLFYTF